MRAFGGLRDRFKTHPLAAVGIAALVLIVAAGGILATQAQGPSGPSTAQGSPTSGTGVTFQVTSIATSTAGGTGTPSTTARATSTTPGATVAPPSGGAATATPGGPGASATPTPLGASPTPTATSAATATAIPTATQTPPAYDFKVVAPLTPSSAPLNHYYVVIENTGANPWTQLPELSCIASCYLGATGWPGENVITVPVGGQIRYNLDISLSANAPLATSLTFHSTWEVNYEYSYNPAKWEVIGANIQLTIVHTIANVVDQQQAPSCGNPPGISWTDVNVSGGDSVTCGGSSLIVQQDGPAPNVELTGVPSGYNLNSYITHVHIHFDDPSPNAYAGYAIDVPANPSQCGYMRLEIRADGVWRVVLEVASDCHEAIGFTGSVSPTNNYDLDMNLDNGGGTLWVNGVEVVNGGLLGPGLYTTLTVHDATGSSGGVEFSNFLYALKSNPPDQFTAANG
jgi:hypothetical protein